MNTTTEPDLQRDDRDAPDLFEALLRGDRRVERRVATNDRFFVSLTDRGGANLSATKVEVIRLTAAGMSQLEQACELGIARSTVSSHLNEGLARIGLTRTDLPFVARRLLEPIRPGVDRGMLASPHIDAALLPQLTEAELDVVRAAATGASNQAIAARRGSSVRTVANQLAVAYRKLEVGSRLELVEEVAVRASLAR